MKIHNEVASLRAALGARRGAGQSVAFVPTMGFLHAGHAALMRAAVEVADVVVVSVFVNPTQFGPGEDLDAYPRDVEGDRALCEAEGVSHLFVPEVAAVYPDGFETTVRVGGLTDGLCGAHRPGHFQGVTTVVAKLFNMVQPDFALFGEKDFQQLTVIRKMVGDLDIPVTIVGVPTVREADGLALSSRNKYLTEDQRRRAPALYAALQRAQARAASGEREGPPIVRGVRDDLAAAGFDTEYVELVALDTLRPVGRVEQVVRLAVAARLGTTRLIDNVAVAPGP